MSKSFIHRSTKKVSRNHGSEKIDLIQSALTECGFHTIQEPRLYNEKFSTPNKIRNPDLKITFSNLTLYQESDGKVHGTLEQPTELTLARNADFIRAGIDFRQINHETIKELRRILGINATIEDLTKFLSVYLVLESYSIHIARSKV